MKIFLYNEYVFQPVLISEIRHKKDKFECVGTISKRKGVVNYTDFIDGKYLKRCVTYVTVYDNIISIRFLGSTESNTRRRKSANSSILVLKTKNGQPVRLDCLKYKTERLKELCVTNLNHLRRGRWGLINKDSQDTQETSTIKD